MIKNQNRQSQLTEIISRNPGIHFREIMRITGMKNGVLTHYVSKLEKIGTIKVHRSPRQTRFFPLDLTEQETKIIKALRRTTPRTIITSLILNEHGLEFTDLVTSVSKAPSTVSFYLSKLVDNGIISIKLLERKKMYYVTDKFIIDKLIENYHPGLLEKQTAEFEDIINSL